MDREKVAPALQQLFALVISLEGKVIEPGPFDMTINLDEISPFAFFTGFLNAVGEDPLCPLRKIEMHLDTCCAVFGAEKIIFKLANKKHLKSITIDDKLDKTWLDLGKQPETILPLFKNVSWTE